MNGGLALKVQLIIAGTKPANLTLPNQTRQNRNLHKHLIQTLKSIDRYSF